MQLRILIADDDQVSRILLSSLITVLGHKSIITADGVELVEEANKKQHDLIITDLFMENMGGEEAAQIIKLLSPNYIIAASTDQISCNLFNDSILKPYKLEELNFAINKFIFLTNRKKNI